MLSWFSLLRKSARSKRDVWKVISLFFKVKDPGLAELIEHFKPGILIIRKKLQESMRSIKIVRRLIGLGHQAERDLMKD